MNLHLQTILYILGFAAISILVTFGLNAAPIMTLSAVSILLFIGFYNLVYTMLKIEKSLKEMKGK